VIIDAAKGLRSVVQKAFGERAAIQRCQWHKRENVLSYPPKGEQALWRCRIETWRNSRCFVVSTPVVLGIPYRSLTSVVFAVGVGPGSGAARAGAGIHG